MAVEIERKYLINKDRWESIQKGKGVNYRQGYLVAEPDKTIRVRISDNSAFLTIKGISKGVSRSEYEYEIPLEDAKELLDRFAKSNVTKVRYKVPYGGRIWEVDEFLEENEGLILAEIELSSEDEVYELPEWVGKEVTDDMRYYNSRLSTRPFKSW
jgi:adenylate cyclase